MSKSLPGGGTSAELEWQQAASLQYPHTSAERPPHHPTASAAALQLATQPAHKAMSTHSTYHTAHMHTRVRMRALLDAVCSRLSTRDGTARALCVFPMCGSRDHWLTHLFAIIQTPYQASRHSAAAAALQSCSSTDSRTNRKLTASTHRLYASLKTAARCL